MTQYLRNRETGVVFVATPYLEALAVMEHCAGPTSESAPDIAAMDKDALEAFGRTLGVELDKRKKIEVLRAEIRAAMGA